VGGSAVWVLYVARTVAASSTSTVNWLPFKVLTRSFMVTATNGKSNYFKSKQRPSDGSYESTTSTPVDGQTSVWGKSTASGSVPTRQLPKNTLMIDDS